MYFRENSPHQIVQPALSFSETRRAGTATWLWLRGRMKRHIKGVWEKKLARSDKARRLMRPAGDKIWRSLFWRRALFSLFGWFLMFDLVMAGEATRPAQARWEEVVKAAEKEGEVTVYATNSVGDLEVIWDAFRKRFPKIKLNSVSISTTSEIVTKVMAERRASQFLVDVVLGAPGATYNSLQRGKALDPLPPALLLPEVRDLSKWWKGKHRYV